MSALLGHLARVTIPGADPTSSAVSGQACAELQRQIEEVQAAIAAAEADLAVVKAALRETLGVNVDKDAQLRQASASRICNI